MRLFQLFKETIVPITAITMLSCMNKAFAQNMTSQNVTSVAQNITSTAQDISSSSGANISNGIPSDNVMAIAVVVVLVGCMILGVLCNRTRPVCDQETSSKGDYGSFNSPSTTPGNSP